MTATRLPGRVAYLLFYFTRGGGGCGVGDQATGLGNYVWADDAKVF